MKDLAQNLILDDFIDAIVNKSNFDSENEIFDSFNPIIASFRSLPFDWLVEL